MLQLVVIAIHPQSSDGVAQPNVSLTDRLDSWVLQAIARDGTVFEASVMLKR